MNSVVETNVGSTRKQNQDRALVCENGVGSLAILCDGMGGVFGGEHASRITVETFEDFFINAFPKNHEVSSIHSWFKKTLKKAKKKMTKFAGKDKALLDMGTTVTMAIVLKDSIYVFNIGDSRTYIYNDLLHQITEDHNVRNYYIRLGWTPEEAAVDYRAASLTSAFGPEKQLREISDYIIERDGKMTIVLTSDGVHDFITKPVFETIIASKRSLQEKALALISQGLKGKSTDNLTVAILEVPNE